MNYLDSSFVYGNDIFTPDEYMGERWAYIDGLPGYMVSDKGRVWSESSQTFIKVKPMDKHGHMGVCLCVNGKRYYEYIHRLMAKAFIPNPNNYPVVRHLDDDPSNNDLYNLAWGTQKDNARDCMENGNSYVLTDEDRYKGNKDRMIPVMAINILTSEKLYFESQTEAGRKLSIPQANIWKVLNKERSSAGGYNFIRMVKNNE